MELQVGTTTQPAVEAPPSPLRRWLDMNVLACVAADDAAPPAGEAAPDRHEAPPSPVRSAEAVLVPGGRPDVQAVPVLEARPLGPARSKAAPVARAVEAAGGSDAIAHLRLERVIGAGAFGVVHLVRARLRADPAASAYLALKSMEKTHVILRAKSEQVCEELRLAKRVQGHPFVTHVVCTFQTSTHLHLLMEACAGGDLFYHLRASRGGRLPEPAARLYAAECLLALEHLHGLGIVFRDLKPENVLLTARGHAKLADFGLCADLSRRGCVDGGATPRLFTLCGSDHYVAPEALRGHGYGAAADLWSLGCLLHEMLCGVPPFHPRTLPVVHEARAAVLKRQGVLRRCWPQHPPGSLHALPEERVKDDRHATFCRCLLEASVPPKACGAPARDLLAALLEKDARRRLGGLDADRAAARACAGEGAAPLGCYAASLKAHPFFAPLGGMSAGALLEVEEPLPAAGGATLLRRVAGGLLGALGRGGGAGGGAEGSGAPEMPFVERHFLRAEPGLPLELCAEAGKSGCKKAVALRELSGAIFSAVDVMPDGVVGCGDGPEEGGGAAEGDALEE